MAMDMERFREVLRDERKRRVGTQGELSEKTGGPHTIPVNEQSISAIERGSTTDPGILTVARLIEAMGLTLSSFFARVEGLSEAVAVSDNVEPQPESPDEALPAFYSEERIAENVLRLLTKLAVEGDERREKERAAHHRLPPDARPLAAERSARHRKGGSRNVPPQKKKRPPKKK